MAKSSFCRRVLSTSTATCIAAPLLLQHIGASQAKGIAHDASGAVARRSAVLQELTPPTACAAPQGLLTTYAAPPKADKPPHVADAPLAPIETVGKEFDADLNLRAGWRLLGRGYGGCEGPQWTVENGTLTLYYAAHHDHLAFKWTQAGGLVTWRNDSPEATSFRPDGHGGFYVVEQTNRRLVRWDSTGHTTEVLADRYEGKLLNRPNDVVERSDGTLWFTDPDFLFKVRPNEVKELPGQYVFRLDLKTKQLTAVVKDLVLPNGIAFSPDEKWLYVTDSGTPNLYRWPVQVDGSLGERQTFATFAEKGLDGLAFDPAGRLWCATKDGIRVLSPEGKIFGLIKTPAKATAFSFAPAPSRLVCVTVHDAAYLCELK